MIVCLKVHPSHRKIQSDDRIYKHILVVKLNFIQR